MSKEIATIFNVILVKSFIHVLFLFLFLDMITNTYIISLTDASQKEKIPWYNDLRNSISFKNVCIAVQAEKQTN